MTNVRGICAVLFHCRLWIDKVSNTLF